MERWCVAYSVAFSGALAQREGLPLQVLLVWKLSPRALME